MTHIPVLDDQASIDRLLSVPWAETRAADSWAGSGQQPRDLPALARAALLPALAGAHAAGEPILVSWLRPAAGAPVEIVLSIGAVRGAYPPGGQVSPCPQGNTARRFRALPAWVRCAGTVDVLAVPEVDHGPAAPGATFEDYVEQLADTPFAWLVVARPVPDDDLRVRLRELAYLMPGLRDRQDTSETGRLDLEQAETRYRELARAQHSGLWDVHLLIGGQDPATTRRTAALLCKAGHPEPLPYALHPTQSAASLDTAWSDGGPFAAPGDLVALIARPPYRELPGIRLVQPSTFDVTPETALAGKGIRLGTVLDRALREAGPFDVSTSTLNRHTFVCGATGSGKSQTVRALLESLHDVGVPWLVIEPAKAEYAGMAGRLDGRADVLVIRPGQTDLVPVSLNPLEPEPGFPLQTHIDLVRALFLAAFEAQDPFPQVLSRALNQCYTEFGWELALGEPRNPAFVPRYPTLGDLQRTADAVVRQIGYGAEVTGNVRGFIDVRLGSLRLGTAGRFFEGGHPLHLAGLLTRNVVLELEDVGNDQDKAFFMGNMLIRIIEHLRVRAAADRQTPRLRHVTVIEEAHRLLKNVEPDSPAAHAVELFAGLLAEIRAYGEGVVVAEQIPAKILPDVIKNTALKIVHRLPSHDDRFAVGATINLDQRQSEYVVTLPPGRAAVFADGMDRPVLAQLPLGEQRETASPARLDVAIARPVRTGCAEDCATTPCTLRQLTTGGRIAENNELALWIELATAAHVLGRPAPRPDPSWPAKLTAQADTRAVDCAVGQLAHAAVDRRYPALAEHYSPEALAAHVAEHIRAAIRGKPHQCDGTEVRWQAGNYRWADVFQALTHPECRRDQPHPLTDSWRERGLDLTGMNAAEQLARLRRLPSSWQADRLAVDGAGDPPEHARLAAALSFAGNPIDRLRTAAHFLTFGSDWPGRRLYPRQWAAREQARTSAGNGAAT